MTAVADQLDLWGTTEPVLSTVEPGIGRVLTTPGGGWRARYTGSRYGWQIDRAITWVERHRQWTGPFRWAMIPTEVSGWESWEPELPHGVEHVQTREMAVDLIVEFALRLGDDPDWLLRRHPAA